MRHISEVYEAVRDLPVKVIAVAAAGDEEVLRAVSDARRESLVRGRLYGDKERIELLLRKLGEPLDAYEIFHTVSDQEAAEMAVRDVNTGKADIVMKGLMDSGTFIKALLNREHGIRDGERTLSAVAAVEVRIEGEERVLFISDPGFIPAPDLKAKKQIILNAVDLLHTFGYDEPKVAVLSANEVVNPKMVSSTDAAALRQMYADGEFNGCRVCGPLSVDLALSKRAARHKGYDDPVAGNADVLIVPDLETGNALLKGIQYVTDCAAGGAVVGTTKPVVFTSRADSAKAKKNTIAMAVLIAERRGTSAG